MRTFNYTEISIHAPREGGDVRLSVCLPPAWIFQSTPPARGATQIGNIIKLHIGISIHAPREGGDHTTFARLLVYADFNPRPPRGGRRHIARYKLLMRNFNPRSPRGGRLHPLLKCFRNVLFQSTPPARGATSLAMLLCVPVDISIHAPREGGDQRVTRSISAAQISIHAPREGGDPVGQ